MVIAIKKNTYLCWTDEEREFVRLNYKNNKSSMDWIANQIGRTPEAIQTQAYLLGITRDHPLRLWTEKETNQLRDLIPEHSLETIAIKLNRSAKSVRRKAASLSLSLKVRDGWFNLKEVASILGVHNTKVAYWIEQRLLKAQAHNKNEWQIKTSDLRHFIVEHTDILIGRNIDIQQIIWIVARKLD